MTALQKPAHSQCTAVLRQDSGAGTAEEVHGLPPTHLGSEARGLSCSNMDMSVKGQITENISSQATLHDLPKELTERAVHCKAPRNYNALHLRGASIMEGALRLCMGSVHSVSDVHTH